MPTYPTEAGLAIAQKLAAAGLGLTLANGVLTAPNLFASKMLPADPAAGVPHAAVFCSVYEGPPAQDYFGSAKGAVYLPRVQVLVRGDVDAVDTARTLALAIQRTLHRADITGYFSCKSLGSAPGDLGNDEAGHPLFSINLELWYKA